MKNNKSLTVHIWIYLAVFLTIILAFLWILQVLFFDVYYEKRTTNMIEAVALKTKIYYSRDKDASYYDKLSYNNNACIQIIQGNDTIYSSNGTRRGCLYNNVENENVTISYILDFINSGVQRRNYKIINPTLDNNTLISAIKLSDDTFAFINVSLEPTDPAIKIIREELIFITIGVFISSFILAYFISKRISTPILKINNRAKMMAKGDLDTPFTVNDNIKEIKELSETLNHTKEELSKIDETRKDLLANVSHDLKTPLTMIKAYAEMARDLNKDNLEKREENLNIIIEETERLNLLVNDILDLSKSESNMGELKKEKFNLTNEIKMILHRFDYLEEQEGYKFIFKEQEDFIVDADKSKINQVIYNLVINAINYTGNDKKVTIKITKIKRNLRVSIIDTGKGISKEEINKIWDKYYKSEKNHKRAKIGTGLGLSIVKNILIKHGFKYGVNSEKGKGTEFYFDIKSY